jgi:methyl-accepting chemotaxis protein
MKLSTNLALGFGLSTILGLGVAMFGAFRVGQMSDSVRFLANEKMAQVSSMYELKDNLNTVAKSVRNIILNNDPAFVQEELALIAAARKNKKEILAQLSQHNLPEDVKAIMEQVQAIRKNYNDILDKSLEFAQKREAKAAADIVFLELRPQQNQLFDNVNAAIALQRNAATALSAQSIDLAKQTNQELIAIALGILVVGGVVSWRMVRKLNVSLGGEPDEVNGAMERIALGDLAGGVAVRAGDSVSTIAVLSSMKASLRGIVESVRANAQNVSAASIQIASGNSNLSQRTHQQTSALEETVHAMQALSTTVRQSATNAKEANTLALNASGVAQEGGAVVGEVVQTMKGINDSSKRIADIIAVIDGIAFQTNILALNAAVEAARAGEQGKGFAVVASEVRHLAGRSSEAAKEIKTLIDESVMRVDQGAILVDQAGKTMTAIVASIEKVTAIVAEITSAAQLQASGIASINNSISALDESTQKNVALVEESTAAAASLSNQAEALVNSVASFRL